MIVNSHCLLNASLTKPEVLGGSPQLTLPSFLMVDFPLEAWGCFRFCQSKCPAFAWRLVISPASGVGSWWPWTVTPGSDNPVPPASLPRLPHPSVTGVHQFCTIPTLMEHVLSNVNIYRDFTEPVNLEGGYLWISLGCFGRCTYGEKWRSGHLSSVYNGMRHLI